MSLITYLFYFFIVLLADIFGLALKFNMTALYFIIALILLGAAAIGKIIANQSGMGYHDAKKAEQMDNSVTKPASFKHEFIYFDYSGKTLFFSELPYIICLIANLILLYSK